MKKLMSVFLVLLLLAGFIQAVTAQTEEMDTPETDVVEQADTDENEQNPAADVSATFTPSEEISEDLSVSFPVDI